MNKKKKNTQTNSNTPKKNKNNEPKQKTDNFMAKSLENQQEETKKNNLQTVHEFM